MPIPSAVHEIAEGEDPAKLAKLKLYPEKLVADEWDVPVMSWPGELKDEADGISLATKADATEALEIRANATSRLAILAFRDIPQTKFQSKL